MFILYKHDGKHPRSKDMSDYSSEHSFHYETLEDVCALAKPHCFLAKVDLKSAHREVTISPLTIV